MSALVRLSQPGTALGEHWGPSSHSGRSTSANCRRRGAEAARGGAEPCAGAVPAGAQCVALSSHRRGAERLEAARAAAARVGAGGAGAGAGDRGVCEQVAAGAWEGGKD